MTVINAAGPLIADLSSSLDEDQRSVLERWAIKSAIIFEYITRKHQLFYTEEECSNLRVSGAIPPATCMWLARYIGPTPFYARANRCSLLGVPGGPLPPQGYLTTLSYGPLIVQVLTVRPFGATTLDFSPAEDPWDALRLRPCPGILTWPPERTVGRADLFGRRTEQLDEWLDEFHYRWGMRGFLPDMPS